MIVKKLLNSSIRVKHFSAVLLNGMLKKIKKILDKPIIEIGETKPKKKKGSKEKKTSTVDRLFKVVLKILRNFEPVKHGHPYEPDIERQLVQALKYGLPKPFKDQVVYEKEIRGGRLDISIGNLIGIELKVEPSRAELDRLYGQVSRYAKEFKRIAVLILYGGAGAKEDIIKQAQEGLERIKPNAVKVLVRGYVSPRKGR